MRHPTLRLSAWLAAALIWGAGGAALVFGPADEGWPLADGTRVRVSSTDAWAGHNPLFVVDGRVGGLLEKWTSMDGRPWLEITLPAPRVLREVVIHHAGTREEAYFNTSDFIIAVRTSAGWRRVAEVTGNRDAVTRHAFPAVKTDAVRLDITKPSQQVDGRARIYEVELHGD